MLGVLIILAAVVAVLVFVVVQLGEAFTTTRADEVHMITTPDMWRIRLCRYKSKKGPGGEPVFFCHGFMANQFNFALPPGDSLIDFLTEHGYDCWAIDLRGARSSEPAYGHNRNEPNFEDHVYRDVPAAIAFIRKTTGYAKVHWIGHSMGGMLLYAYDAAMGSDTLASGTTIGAPVGFEDVDLKRQRALFALRRASEKVFRGCARILFSILGKFKIPNNIVPVNYDNLHPKLDAKSLFVSFEAPALPLAEQMIEYANRKEWKLDGGTIDVHGNLKNISVPLFAIFGVQDVFILERSAKKFFDAVVNPDKKYLMLSKANGHAADYNHIDLVMGAACAKDVFAPILAWVKKHPITERMAAEEEKLGPDAEVIESYSGDAQKPAAKKTAPRKAPAKAAPARKAAAKVAVAKAAVAKVAVAKVAAAKAVPARKAPVEAAPAKKAAVVTKAAPVKRAPAKASAAKKPTAMKPGAKAAVKAKATAKKASAKAKPAKKGEQPAESESVRAAASRAGKLRAALEDIPNDKF